MYMYMQQHSKIWNLPLSACQLFMTTAPDPAQNELSFLFYYVQAAEKFKAPQPAPVVSEAKAAAIEQEEESDEEEVT